MARPCMYLLTVLLYASLRLEQTEGASLAVREPASTCRVSRFDSTWTCFISSSLDLNEIPRDAESLVLGFTNSLHTINVSDFKLPPLPSLTRLQLIVTYMETLTRGALENLPLLVQLTLFDSSAGERGPVTLLPGSLRGPAKLSKLYLSALGMTSLPPQLFKGLPDLQLIDLNQNKLVDLNGTFTGCCEKLTYLNLAKNRIRDIPVDTFSSLGRLKGLDLYGNEIRRLRYGSLYGMTSLTEINLAENGLETLDSGAFRGLIQLRNLFLDSNSIRSVPSDALQGLEELRHLDLSRNQLREIEASTFYNTPLLTTLLLNDNGITSVHDHAFNGLSATLERLDLSHNSLTTLLSKSFSHLASLKSLNLQSNRISSIDPDTFQSLSSLLSLDLSLNQLQDLTASLPHSLSHLTLSHNPFLCSCSLLPHLIQLYSSSSSSGSGVEDKPLHGDIEYLLCAVDDTADGSKAESMLIPAYHALHCSLTSSTRDVTTTATTTTTSTDVISSPLLTPRGYDVTTIHHDVTPIHHDRSTKDYVVTTTVTNLTGMVSMATSTGYHSSALRDVTTPFTSKSQFMGHTSSVVSGDVSTQSVETKAADQSEVELVPTGFIGSPTVIGPLDFTPLQTGLILGGAIFTALLIIGATVAVVRWRLSKCGAWKRRSLRKSSPPSKPRLPTTTDSSHSNQHDDDDDDDDDDNDDDTATASVTTSSYDVSTHSSSLHRDVTSRYVMTSHYDVEAGTNRSLLCDVEDTVVTLQRDGQDDVTKVSLLSTVLKKTATAAENTQSTAATITVAAAAVVNTSATTATETKRLLLVDVSTRAGL